MTPCRLWFLALPLTAAVAAPLAAQHVPWRTAAWEADSTGHYRAVVRVGAPGAVAWAHLPWRRHDDHPEARAIIVEDARTGRRIANAVAVTVSAEYGDIVFEPASGPGEYRIYYMPYTGTFRSPYPRITYRPPVATADSSWLRRHGLAGTPRLARIPRARVVAFESSDAWNDPVPMELAATRAEEAALLRARPRDPFLVFPEDRRFPIRMTTHLPVTWVRRGARTPWAGTARRGEFYAFQLGVWAARGPLHDVRVRFTDLRAADGHAVAAAAFRCVNQGGVDWQGRDFTRPVPVDSGTVQALWCGVQVPVNAAPGRYAATLTVADGPASVPVALRLTIGPDTIRNAGDDEPWRLSRLRWLDSRLAEDDGVVPPYTPVTVHGDTVGVLGRQVVVGPDGLPAAIRSWFAIEMTGMADAPRDVLAGPIALVVAGPDGQVFTSRPRGVRMSRHTDGAAEWAGGTDAGPVAATVTARMEFDGNLEFRVAVTAREAATLGDVRLEIPLAADVARYMLGMGRPGGTRPDTLTWRWAVEHNQDGAWIGDVNAGLQFTLRDDRYRRPLNTNFYLRQPLVMPASWQNGGAGGCRLGARGPATYLVTCFSGPRTMAAGEVQHYDFRLLVTPFHALDTRAQWTTRYYHRYTPLDSIARMGANTINVHHATAINPYINYPFLRPDAMRGYIDSAHARGMRVKIYYTVRELTDHAPELWALRSLGSEVIAPGAGGGSAWLMEHVGGSYISGWHVPDLADAAVVNTGISRWHNFYIEGLRWLTENVGIDGLYLDDVAFDRTVMQRVRRVLTRGRPAPLIDLHSANQYNRNDGFASSANLYLEHFPYIDRLWFGEYFDYDAAPDYWLTEIAGIPFGLMGEMLQDGGNPWRGMVFGMTARLPWAGDPRPLWRTWDDFGMTDTRMTGFWVPSNPVRTGRPDVPATVYRRAGRAMIALASWAADTVRITPQVDWAALGLDAATAQLRAPAIDSFQVGATYAPGDAIAIAPGRGWLLVAEPR